MTAKTELTEITVYWDEQDPQNIGWAYQACHIRDGENEVADSGSVSVDGSASLDDAVDEVCYQLGVDLDHNDFSQMSHRRQPPLCCVWIEAN